jgi:hypothetical protein
MTILSPGHNYPLPFCGTSLIALSLTSRKVTFAILVNATRIVWLVLVLIVALALNAGYSTEDGTRGSDVIRSVAF